MQIVIDMSDDDYRKVQDGRASVSMMREIIRNGTPLPKGHGLLIDADAYIDKHEEYGWLDDIRVYEFNTITPTIIEAENEGEEE